MAPEADWDWLAQIYRALRAQVRPTRDKLSRLKPIDELVALGERLMDEAESAPEWSARRRAVLFRDGLMIAVLAYRPVRLKNFARHAAWPPSDEGRRLLAHPLRGRRDQIARSLRGGFPLGARGEARALSRRPSTRPLLGMRRRRNQGGACPDRRRSADRSGARRRLGFGVGTQLEPEALQRRIFDHTRQAFGRGVSPHLFRDAAATSIAMDNPRHVGDASLVLGHAGHRMTEKHYNHARSLEASRRHAETLARLRRLAEPRAEGLREFRMRAVIYARYSSDQQRTTSIDDQIRLCKERIAREGWTLVQVYRDSAMSGATALRPGYQAMLEGAREAAFDVVVAEALDRLSRDQEDIAALFKRLQFAGIRLVTLGEGEIGVLHIGLKGTMNALFLKDLADKTRRGLRGRIEAGKSGGGNAYGYDLMRSYDANGEPVRGGRTINAAEAEVVREIFSRYAAGEAPRRIAFDLNARRIPAPARRRLEREHAERQSRPRHRDPEQ